MKGFANMLKNISRNKWFLLMVLPATIWFLLFSYLPMVGTIIAFKSYRYSRDGFWASLFQSDWVGFKNFKFLFATHDAYIITRNTLLYNLAFIILGLICSVAMAVVLSEIVNKKLAKVYQTGMFLPHFLSWVIIGYFAFAFLSEDKGVLNQILTGMGLHPISWYSDKTYWPVILIVMNVWKELGYTSVMYLAAIVGIDRSYYEAAMIDGASKWQQFKNITLPAISPLIITLTLLNVGRIFYSDFGLFFQLPRDSGALYAVTNTIDTYVYRGLTATGEIGMSTAAGLYQSLVGFILVMAANLIVRRIDKDSSLF
ncbi:ABC transporter permease [Paenibacillus chibensis]|uniref:ABC transporter permease n=1 Tax=Paenibacillus chibensis TaxID=59846 RepID=UPI000FDCADD7|nr:ABC transporter permease subunit [Paenibacillus chibensis]MEC0371178.1 ABC transporter permease subunit [Paenibacillus chibensis]